MTRRLLRIVLTVLMTCGCLCQSVHPQVLTKTGPVATSGPSPQGDGREWLNPPSEGAFPDGATHAIQASDVYEVVASKNYVPVVRDLKDRAYVKLTPDSAVYFTGHYFQCPKGKTPYLVRAVYGHGGTGKYSVMRFGRKVLIDHGSLGRTDAANKSALLVNLDFEPEAIYTVVHIAG